MYLVRRFLYFSWDEWERLPGYQQLAYAQMLREAQPWTDDGGPVNGKHGGGGGADQDIEGSLTGLGR